MSKMIVTFCKLCGQFTANNHLLISGNYYWIRHKVEMVWRPCYVFEDPDNMLWYQEIGKPAFPVIELDADFFEIKELRKP